jgi:putative Mg2+ transporter-C (MgtC) family protein
MPDSALTGPHRRPSRLAVGPPGPRHPGDYDTLDAMGSDWDLVGRIAVAFGLSFVIGFEREIRGGAAGDRTFALVGTAAAAIAVIAVSKNAGNAIAGVVTGVGFIGGALLFRGEAGVLRGLTSASAVLATAAIGVVAGAGYLVVAAVVAALVLLALEIRFLPGLSYLDSRRYVGSVRSDDQPPGERRRPDPPSGSPRHRG